MIRISNIKMSINEDKEGLKHKIAKKLRLDNSGIMSFQIYKESIDARKKDRICFLYTVDVEVQNENKVLHMIKDKDVTKATILEYRLPEGKTNVEKSPIVVGFGPAGIFAALVLSEMGLKPIVLERGDDVDKRAECVDLFWKQGILNTESNVQFGEGGAGTFSDGKLTTRIKDLRCRKVLEEMVAAGAPDEIMYSSKPHIGTDKLKMVVKNLREKIIKLGGQVRFNSKVTDIVIENGQTKGVIVNESEQIDCDQIILSIGHSARDTFEMLYKKELKLDQKPFAMGVRIEHTQNMVNIAQYGEDADKMEAADYKLTYRTKKGRSVYTFCMCPGGEVVGAASEEGMVATNGMSVYARNNENANSALLVQVSTEDFGGSHPLQGMYFQRELEKKAFIAGGSNYNAPAQLVGDFLKGKESVSLGEIKNTYRPNVKLTSLEGILPQFISESIKEAIPEMGKKLKGFDREDALLTGVESRSSSPIRIVRDNQSGECINCKGIYPSGEGAGYAGGIVSAAVDGIIAAEKIFDNYKII